MTEIFKDIPGYAGLYQVSNLGTVKTCKRQGTDSRIRKGYTDRGGYMRMALCSNGTTKTFGVHKLVCMAFLPNPEGKRTVNHKDGDKLNNTLVNLEWMTHAENHQHAFSELGRKSSMLGKTGALHPNAKAVTRTDKLSGVSITYHTLTEAAASGDFSIGHISSCISGKRKSHGGYFWTKPADFAGPEPALQQILDERPKE